jgi:hypothetical protein
VREKCLKSTTKIDHFSNKLSFLPFISLSVLYPLSGREHWRYRHRFPIVGIHITGSLGQQSFLAYLIRQAVKVLISAADRNVVTAAQKAAVVDTVFDLASSDASDNAFSPTPNSG